MLRPYQTELLNGVKSVLKTSPIACIAAGTGSGKTEIAIQFMKDNPTKRFLILAHGQKELRTNFYARVVSRNVTAYELKKATLKSVVAVNNARIVVTLPHTLHNHLDSVTSFDYLIVDEAHQIYEGRQGSEAKMYTAIKAWHKGDTVIMTASHYGLKSVTKDQKVFFSREQGFEQEAIQDARLCRRVVKGSHVRDEDFSKTGELKEEVHVNSHSVIKEFIKSEYFPMIISVRRREEADEVLTMLPKKVKALVSHGENDKDADNIAAFKAGKADICIVVNRAQLGFDYSELRTFVDATYTKNVTRIEQMVGRLTRKSEGAEKKFIKLTLSHMQDEYALICTAVLALGATELYTTWDGDYRNLSMKVPVKRPGSVVGESGEGVDAKERTPSIDRQRLATLEMTFGEYKEQFALFEPISLYEAICEVSGVGPRDPDKVKAKLIALAESHAPRPAKREQKLGNLLVAYTCEFHAMYDPQFTDRLKRLAPIWFLGQNGRAKIKKDAILELANSGQARPTVRGKSGLGKSLTHYVSKHNKCYDIEFHQQLLNCRPDWFISRKSITKEKKEVIINLAKRGDLKPNKGSELYLSFNNYICKGATAYDPEFDAQIRALRPDWFRK